MSDTATMSDLTVSVDFPADGQDFTAFPFASGQCSPGVLVGGQLTREATGSRPRKVLQGYLASFCPVPCDSPDADSKSWLLLFDYEPDEGEQYTLTVSDEWTGTVLATVCNLTISLKAKDNPALVRCLIRPRGSLHPLDPFIAVPPPPSNPLPLGFTCQVQSTIRTPTPSLSLTDAVLSAQLKAGPIGGSTFTWYFSCQVSNWDGTPATLTATQGSGNQFNLPGLTFS